MERSNNVKKFILYFDISKAIDIDLLEVQLHSLYKLKNINLDEASFFNDLNQCNMRATALTLAKKSFIKALTATMENQNITLEDFDISTVDLYSGYVIRMTLDKDFIARNLRKEICEGVDNISGKRIKLAQRSYRIPLAVFAYEPRHYILNKEKLTKSAAYKKTLDDLITWEKDIVERLIAQINAEYILTKMK